MHLWSKFDFLPDELTKSCNFNVTYMSSLRWRILKSRTRLTVTLFYKSRLPQLLIIAVIHVGMQIRSFNRCLHGLRLLLTAEVNNIIWMGTSASRPGPRGQPGLNNVNTRWTGGHSNIGLENGFIRGGLRKVLI